MTIRRRAPAVRGWVRAFFVLGVLGVAAPDAGAQFIPYYGKNKVIYDSFSWRVYKSPHFEVYYYPEFEQHLARIVSYAESSYQKVSGDLKHEIGSPIPLILYKTHSEFEETNLYPDFIPEGVLAFAEPVRGRMVMPIDLPPDELQGLITHELTHVFEFDLIPRNLVQRNVPLWLDEGLADYMRGTWDPLDLQMIRDAAVTEQVPKISRFEDYGGSSNVRLVYNLGHAAFEFIEARYGKEGIRQFLYTFRKNIVGGGMEEIYQQAFRLKPEEFDEAFEKWLKERFKPFRDKQRPSDYGKDLPPDEEKTSYTQVFAFSGSPSGEVVAALSGNRAEGEADLILLSTKDGTVLKNLTKGYTGKFENITMSEDFVAGRSIDFAPDGDTVAFFARKGKRRSLYLVSVVTGDIVKRIPVELDQAEAPAVLPDGKRVLFAALKEGVSDIYLLDVREGGVKNLTADSYADSDPQISPDGNIVVYTRRISGHDKLYMFRLDDPSKKTQLTFGNYDDRAPTFTPDGNAVFYSSTEDDDIYNVRSLDLRTGVVRQFTDALGGNTAPEVIAGKGATRVAFISYFKGEFKLHSIEVNEPIKEVEQEVLVADASDIVDFQPDISHQVVSQNKRRKRIFEKLYLEGRPPLNVGITSGGDFFGGSQIALSDVLGDKNFVFTAMSLREFRSYQGTYINLGRRLQHGFSAFDNTQFFYASPYDLQAGFFREGAFATERVTGATLIAQYPLSKFSRLEFNAGVVRLRQRFENAFAEVAAQEAAAGLGTGYFLQNGSFAPITLSLVGETTRFREFGPWSGATYSLGFTYAPGFGDFLSQRTVELDARKYLRLGTTSALLAVRARGFRSSGTNPGLFYFGGNHELRGYPYLSLTGTEGFHANAEFRFPIIHLMATPIGVLGPIRGTLFAGIGSAKLRGDPAYQFGTREAGVSYVRDPVFGEPVSGFHLVDGRASYGVGLQFFFLGYPLHFDWTKLTDLKVSSPGWKFDFWIGFDF
jgi:dipeptidyl aminopeptidase/acylaminoacyl peptidase